MPKVRKRSRKAAISRPFRERRGKPSALKHRSDSLATSGSATRCKAGYAPTQTTSSHVPAVSSVMKLLSEFRQLCTSYVASHSECRLKAPQMEKYLRSQFKVFGIQSPARRDIQAGFIKSHRGEFEDRNTLLQLVTLLWQQEEREFQYFGADLMRDFRDKVLGTSLEHFQEATSCVEQLVTSKSWWDTVDALSYPVMGYFVQQRLKSGVALMYQWIQHDNLWLRRVAILHQLCLKEKTDADRLFKFCLERAHEKEFFIRKAIGWALRDYSRANKSAVKEFVETNRDSLSALSIREALKHC